MPRPKGSKNKSKDAEAPTVEEIEGKQNKQLLEQLTELQAKVKKQEEALDPKSGPGQLCECWKISIGEALQEGPDERGQYGPIKEGYFDGSDAKEYPKRRRFDGNRRFLIYKDTKDDEFVPLCESKYTKPYERNVRLNTKTYDAFEWDKEEVQLCKKHAETLLGIVE